MLDGGGGPAVRLKVDSAFVDEEKHLKKAEKETSSI
jgi:hypothetical protein